MRYPYMLWSCKIGTLGPLTLPSGTDASLRASVEKALRILAGRPTAQDIFCTSGWNARLTEAELAAHEGRPPNPTHHAEWEFAKMLMAKQFNPDREELASFVDGMIDYLETYLEGLTEKRKT